MTDLLARLAQRPPITAEPSMVLTRWHQLGQQAAYDRDLALDALAAVLVCNRSVCINPRQCVKGCMADRTARAILRELRPQHSAGAQRE